MNDNDKIVFFVLWAEDLNGPKQIRIIPSPLKMYNYLCAQMFNIELYRDDPNSPELNISGDCFDSYEEAENFIKTYI